MKSDFPRIPFTKDHRLFSKMSKYGNRLVDLHLLKSSEIDKPISKFCGKGDNKIEKLTYDEMQKQVYFNSSQYIEKVSKDVWEYQIGGYQVCNKWLKDRKGKRLSAKDIKHYCKVVTSLKKIIKIQEEIDGIYDEVEKNVIDFEMR